MRKIESKILRKMKSDRKKKMRKIWRAKGGKKREKVTERKIEVKAKIEKEKGEHEIDRRRKEERGK